MGLLSLHRQHHEQQTADSLRDWSSTKPYRYICFSDIFILEQPSQICFQAVHVILRGLPGFPSRWIYGEKQNKKVVHVALKCDCISSVFNDVIIYDAMQIKCI